MRRSSSTPAPWSSPAALGLRTLRHSTLAARPEPGAPDALGLRTALRNRAYLAALAAGFAGDWALVGARAAMVPQFAHDSLGLSSNWVYAAFLVGSIASGALLLPFGKVADVRGRRPVIAFGLLVGAVGFLLLPALHSAAGLMIAMTLLGVAAAADAVAPGAVMGDVVVRSRRDGGRDVPDGR